jgi:hypothetical protein
MVEPPANMRRTPTTPVLPTKHPPLPTVTGPRGRAVAISGLLLAMSGLLMTSPATVSASDSDAHVSAVLGGVATAHLHLIQAEGSQLIEEGPVSGALTGSARAKLRTGATFTGQFTIRTRHGTIKGSGTAHPKGAGRYQSFSGSFLATGGTGRYAHIHGNANLYGTIDRRTDNVIIQTVANGKLTY